MSSFDRRDLMKGALALGAAATLPRAAFAQDVFAPKPGAWRVFEIVTRLEMPQAKRPTQAWVPLPAFTELGWHRPMGSQWTTNGAAEIRRDPKYGAEMLYVQWSEVTAPPVVEINSKLMTRDRAVDFAQPGKAPALSAAERRLYTEATALMPTDGIVRQTADKVVAGKKGDEARARALYEWVVENTFRDPKTRGCGTGDIAAMLKTGNLGGKCADLNALYVGLARAAGLPARDVYGLRVVPSKFGYKSLGAGSEVVTRAQHCRAEVFLSGHGWVPVDPADVRKVVLEEPPGNLAIGDAKVAAARKALFGGWEMNWLAYNVAHDVNLPGAKSGPVEFLMYPQAETGGVRLDSLDPDNFKYTIKAKELASA